MLRKIGLLLVLAALVGSGCGDSKDSADADKSEFGKNEPLRDRVMKLQYSLVLDGEVDVTFDKEIEVRVMTVAASSPQISLSLLSLGPVDPITLPDGGRLRAAFDLTGYKGDGKYTIQAGSPRDRLAVAEAAKRGEKVGTPDQSNVLVQHWLTEDVVKTEPFKYDVAVEPCSLEVSDDGREGVLRCATVTDFEKKKSFSLEMRWEKTKNTAKSEKNTTPSSVPATPTSVPATPTSPPSSS